MLPAPGWPIILELFWILGYAYYSQNYSGIISSSLSAVNARFLNSATDFLFQIFNVIGQALPQYSKFLCSTVYLLPVINWTRTLVGWSDVRSLINTDGGIPALKTLPGKVFPQTLPRGLGLGSRLLC